MPKYDVNYLCEVNFHIEADNEDDAIQIGYDMLEQHTVQELYFDCNECYEIEDSDDPEYMDEDV